MGLTAKVITVSNCQSKLLKRIVDSPTEEHRRVERARIVLMSADGIGNIEQAKLLGVDVQRVWRWRRRWWEAETQINEAESGGATKKELVAKIKKVLSDEYRSGTTPKFTAEQITQIVAVACESPSDSGLPVSHWTPKELATEVIKRGIVTSISPRQVDRFLK